MQEDLELDLTVRWYRFRAENYCNPISTKDKSRLHQFGAKMLPGIFVGCALNSGERWAGDVIIADWHDIENYVTSKVHIKKVQVQRSCSQETAGNMHISLRRWLPNTRRNKGRPKGCSWVQRLCQCITRNGLDISPRPLCPQRVRTVGDMKIALRSSLPTLAARATAIHPCTSR